MYLTDSSPAARRAETNFTAMRQKLEKTAVLVPTDKDRELQSLATPEQARDLQQFHEIGNQHF